jgi:hypothetical protein
VDPVWVERVVAFVVAFVVAAAGLSCTPAVGYD